MKTIAIAGAVAVALLALFIPVSMVMVSGLGFVAAIAAILAMRGALKTPVVALAAIAACAYVWTVSTVVPELRLSREADKAAAWSVEVEAKARAAEAGAAAAKAQAEAAKAAESALRLRIEAEARSKAEVEARVAAEAAKAAKARAAADVAAHRVAAAAAERAALAASAQASSSAEAAAAAKVARMTSLAEYAQTRRRARDAGCEGVELAYTVALGNYRDAVSGADYSYATRRLTPDEAGARTNALLVEVRRLDGVRAAAC